MELKLRAGVPYVLGTVCGSAACALRAMLLFWNPYRATDAQGAVIATLMSVLIVCGVGAALLPAPWGMVVFGLAALPVGLYILLSPGIFAFIGVADIGFVVTAIWALLARRHERVID
jgi:hypothetical protein